MDMPFSLFRFRLGFGLGVFLVLAPVLLAPAQTNSPATNSAPTPVSALAPPKIIAQHDVVFGKGGEHDLHAEIAYPANATGLLPAIIYVHGGGFVGGSQKQSPILQIARAGFFGASIEYRLSGVAKWPAQIEDCKLAVRWLRANAAQYHVDPNHIGVWGASAGGHLVACIGTMSDEKEYEGEGGYPGVSSAVQAVVDFFGPVDFFDPRAYSPQSLHNAEGLFGTTHDQNPELWKSGSPLFYVKAGDPPMFLAHGDADTTVPVTQSMALDAALTKVGVPHELVIVKNAGHSFRPLPGKTIDPSMADINRKVFAFFDKYLKAP